MSAWWQVRDALDAKYGRPTRLPDDIPGEVIAFAHTCRESAEGYAAGDRDFFGHPSWVEIRESVGWTHVVDLRPSIVRARADIEGRS